MDDLVTETGCRVVVRSFPMTDPMKIALVLDMGPADGRITPEVLFTRNEARAMGERLIEAASR